MSEGRTVVTGFLERLKPLEDLWPCGDLRYSAYKQDGEWRNVATQLTLRWDTLSDSIQTPSIQYPRFLVGRQILPWKAVVETLSAADNGDFTAGGNRIRLDYVQIGPQTAHATVRASWSQWYLGPKWQIRGIAQVPPESLLGYGLTANGGAISDFVDAETWGGIRHALLLAHPPYAGFEDLSSNFLTTSDPLEWNWPSRFQCTAPLGTQFDEWNISEGSLIGKLLVPPTLKPEDLRITAILGRLSRIDRLTVIPGGFESNPVPKFRSSPFSIPFEGYSWADLHLLLRGIEVDRFRLSLPSPESRNPRLKALEALDRIPVLLNQAIADAPSSRSTDTLETLVAWILHLCGFQVMGVDTGPMRGKAGLVCDLLAFDPYSNDAVVIDVTLSEPLNSEKLAKVRVRTDAVQSKLAELKVRAVIAVPGRDDFLPEELTAAAGVAVRLVSRSDLREMIESAQENEMPSTTTKRFFSSD